MALAEAVDCFGAARGRSGKNGINPKAKVSVGVLVKTAFSSYTLAPSFVLRNVIAVALSNMCGVVVALFGHGQMYGRKSFRASSVVFKSSKFELWMKN